MSVHTVEQDRSHLAKQVEYARKCGRDADEHVPRAALDKLAGMMGCTFPYEETPSIRITGIRKWQQLGDCQCSTRIGGG